MTTDNDRDPDRVPTWSDMREVVHAQGADLDATRTEPRGIAGAQHERWLSGHDYAHRQVAEPPPPPAKPRPKVTVRGTERYAKRGSMDVRTANGGYDGLAARLRAEGIDATSTGKSLRIPPGQQVQAATLLRGWAAKS